MLGEASPSTGTPYSGRPPPSPGCAPASPRRRRKRDSFWGAGSNEGLLESKKHKKRTPQNPQNHKQSQNSQKSQSQTITNVWRSQVRGVPVVTINAADQRCATQPDCVTRRGGWDLLVERQVVMGVSKKNVIGYILAANFKDLGNGLQIMSAFLCFFPPSRSTRHFRIFFSFQEVARV